MGTTTAPPRDVSSPLIHLRRTTTLRGISPTLRIAYGASRPYDRTSCGRPRRYASISTAGVSCSSSLAPILASISHSCRRVLDIATCSKYNISRYVIQFRRSLRQSQVVRLTAKVFLPRNVTVHVHADTPILDLLLRVIDAPNDAPS